MWSDREQMASAALVTLCASKQRRQRMQSPKIDKLSACCAC